MKSLSQLEIQSVSGGEDAVTATILAATTGTFAAIGTAVGGPVGTIIGSSIGAGIGHVIGENKEAIAETFLKTNDWVAESMAYGWPV